MVREGGRDGMVLFFPSFFGLVWLVYSLFDSTYVRGWPMSCVPFDGILFGRNLPRIVLVNFYFLGNTNGKEILILIAMNDRSEKSFVQYSSKTC